MMTNVLRKGCLPVKVILKIGHSRKAKCMQGEQYVTEILKGYNQVLLIKTSPYEQKNGS